MEHNKEKELIIEIYKYYKNKDKLNKLINKHDLLISENNDIVYLKKNWFIDLKYSIITLFYVISLLLFFEIHSYTNDYFILFLMNTSLFLCFPYFEYLIDVILLKLKNKTKRKFILKKLKYSKSFREIYFSQKTYFYKDKKEMIFLKKLLDQKKPLLNEAVKNSNPDKLVVSYYSLLGKGVISDEDLYIIDLLSGYIGVDPFYKLNKHYKKEKQLKIENNYL